MDKGYKIIIMLVLLLFSFGCVSDNTGTDQASTVQNIDDSDAYTFKKGSLVEFPNGYVLTAKQIDVGGGKVWVEFQKDGTYITDEIIYANRGEKEYNIDKNGAIFRLKLIEIPDSKHAIIKVTWLNEDETKAERMVTEDKVQTIPSEYDSSLVRDYEIVETENDPWKNAIRKQYRVLVPADISKEELKATLIQIVMDKASENKDIDAICVFAYERKEDVNSAYTLGTADWCPNGNWGDVTPEIASNNDRSSYEYVFNIMDKVGNQEIERPTYLEFEINDYYYVCSDAEWDKIDLSDPYAVVDEDVVYQKVAEKYGITKEEAEEICMKVELYNLQ